MRTKKNLKKGMLAAVMAVGLFVAEFPVVKAAEKTELINVVQNEIKFVDEHGEVMAVFTPYSETNPAPDGLTKSTLISVGFSLPGNNQGYLSNKYDLKDRDKISLNISISPQVSSNVGLYNHDKHEYGWPEGGLTSYGWYGDLTVYGSGTYSMAFRNNSGTTAEYSGSYTVP